jgi:hypothetical protein
LHALDHADPGWRQAGTERLLGMLWEVRQGVLNNSYFGLDRDCKWHRAGKIDASPTAMATVSNTVEPALLTGRSERAVFPVALDDYYKSLA